MQAIVLDALGGSEHFRLAELKTPEPAKGEVRIRVTASGFNPVDYKLRQGRYRGKLPVVLGADCSGIIDAVGPEVQGFVEGDAVYAYALGPVSNGSYAEYLCLPSVFVAKKPSNLSFERAAGVPLTALTAYRCIVASGALCPHQAIFISGGTGGVGTMAIQMARHLEADPILTSAGSEESGEYLQRELRVPLEQILFYKGLSVEEMVDRIIRMNKGHRVRVACDFTGQQMKLVCLDIADYSGHVMSIVDEKKGLPDLWNRETSPAFQKSLTVHYVFVGAEALLGGPSSWEIYSSHLAHITSFIEAEELLIPEPKILDGLTVENVRLAHHLLEDGHLKGKLVMKL